MLTRLSLSVMLLAFMALVQVQAAAAQGVDLSIVLLERLYEFHTPAVLKRQSTNSTNTSVPLSDFPPQCQGGCKLSITALNQCSAATCLCNSTVEESLSYCINCSVNNVPTTTVIQSGQKVVDSYNTLCKGVPDVTSIFLNITVSTGASSATGAATTVAVGLGSSTSFAGSGPTTTITSLSTAAPATGGGSGAAATGGPSASMAVGTRANVGYVFVILVVALVVPFLA